MCGIIVTSAVILNLIAFASAATQVDLRLGAADFFLGEKFLITVSDVIYWISGMTMGIIIAVTFLIVSEFYAVKDALASKNSRGRRLIKRIGSDKRSYPNNIEQRVLTAIHTSPDNYLEQPGVTTRQGRLIGSPKYPTHLEHLALDSVDSPPANDMQDEER